MPADTITPFGFESLPVRDIDNLSVSLVAILMGHWLY